MRTPSTDQIAIDRPVRWDHPLDREMLTRDIGWMLKTPTVLRNECGRFSIPWFARRSHPPMIVASYDSNRVISWYGKAITVAARISFCAVLFELFLEALWQARGKPADMAVAAKWHDWLKQRFKSSKKSVAYSNNNRRGRSRNKLQEGIGDKQRFTPVQQIEEVEGKNRIFLQDINAVIEGFESEPLGVGEIFGEMAAITRSQHRYTVVADTPTIVLEIRWQGLRMLRRDKKFREYLDERFRETSLQTHLRETPLLRFLDDESMALVIAQTSIQSIGDREWFSEYRDTQKLDVQSQISREPVIAAEGQSVKDLILIRAGFARMSFEQGRGHETIAYLGRGQVFGLSELAHQFRNPKSKPLPYQESLRALGFVDILRIPSKLVLSHVLPKIRNSELPRPISHPRYTSEGLVVSRDRPRSQLGNTVAVEQTLAKLETSLVEFLVDERLINGKQTMMIDLDRLYGMRRMRKSVRGPHITGRHVLFAMVRNSVHCSLRMRACTALTPFA